MILRAVKPAVLFCIVILAVACYLPGLTGSFIFDDGANISNNPGLKISSLDAASLLQAAHSGGAGPLKRPVSMMSFALNYYVTGLDAYYFKLVNLGIHLVNGLLVFAFARLLLSLHLRVRQAAVDEDAVFWTALGIAAIWLLHPFNLTGVLYAVQRMTSLAALFTLAGLLLYLHGRRKLLDGRASGFIAIASAIFIATPLAALCKENGALLPLLIGLTEVILLRWKAPDQNTRRILMAMVGLSVIIPLLAGLFYVLNNPGLIMAGYSWRDFSLIERLMTEARVIWFYLHMILLPDMAEMGLYHDDILISRSLFSPWTTLPAITGLLLLAGGAFALRNKHPMITFGIAFFLVGQLLESTIIPLEIAFEYRNYLPMFGILLPLVYYMLNPRLHLPSLRLRRVILPVVIILFAGITALRAQQWGDTLMMRMLEVERHPNSVRANTDMAAFYNYTRPTSQENAADLYNKAAFYYRQAAEVAPSNITGLLGLLVIKAERGLPPDPALLEAIEHLLATAPFNPPNKNSLVGMIRCIGDGSCAVQPYVIGRLYRAALSNPTLTGDHRNQVVSAFDQLPSQIWPELGRLK